tara:strand:- start:29 stop:412 length:384 start_codon:yes stop_codon:yes gene_type:complete
MPIKIITATLDKIERRNAKSGDPGCSVVLKYDDGSEWGKSIYQWLWTGRDLRDNQKLDMQRWAALIDQGEDFDSARKVIVGDSHEIFGVMVDLQVDTEPKFWKIINFGKEGSLQQAETSPPSSDIPF